MKNKPNTSYCLFTNDVETHSLWLNNLRDETGAKVMTESMPLLLDLYAKHNVKSTFFYTGYIARKFPDVVRMVLKDGHEVACHGLSHLPKNGFDVMPYEKQLRHLVEAKKILEDIAGVEVLSFRAPALRVNQHTTTALSEAGFRIDSSIAAQRFDFFFSFGSLKKFKFLTAPRLPYKTSANHLHKKGEGPIIEVPISSIILPYIGSTLRAMPGIAGVLRRLLVAESRRNKKPIVFYSHPAEYLDESEEFAQVKHINKRVKGAFEYFIRDYLKTKIKHKNLGPDALGLLEKEITFLQNHGFHFVTMKDYCDQQGLLSNA